MRQPRRSVPSATSASPPAGRAHPLRMPHRNPALYLRRPLAPCPHAATLNHIHFHEVRWYFEKLQGSFEDFISIDPPSHRPPGPTVPTGATNRVADRLRFIAITTCAKWSITQSR